MDKKTDNNASVRQGGKAYRAVFFTLSLLLAVSFAWSVYDDAVTRRPWKRYQKKFFRLEADILKEELKEQGNASAPRPGNAELRMKIRKLLDKTPEIEQIVMKDFAVNNFGEPVLKVDRCTSCHMAAGRKGFEKFPEPFKTHTAFEVFSKHPTGKFGCTSCHDGQGEGLSFYDAAHTPVDDEQARQWRETLDWEPLRHRERPMLRGDFIQSSCRACHMLEYEIRGAPVLSRGIKLFRNVLGCVNCHPVKGYEDVSGRGPDLTSAGSKVSPGWLFNWIKEPGPRRVKPGMPDFALSDRQALSVTAYIMSLKGDMGWKKYTLENDVLQDAALRDKGRDLVLNRGCAACHSIPGIKRDRGDERETAPDLSLLKDKTSPDWVLNWIMGPAGYAPKTPMPDLRLTPGEGKAITAYLMTASDSRGSDVEELKNGLGDTENIARGLEIIKDYQCYGCHNIPGTENAEMTGPELTGFGDKQLHELAFGDAKNVGPDWRGYTRAKIRTPGVFATEKMSTRMPAYDLTEDEVHALTVLLKSFRDESIPGEFTRAADRRYTGIQDGRRLIRRYNCIACHEVEKGWGGENIRSALSANSDKETDPALFPPALAGEGWKVQSGWLFDFISGPEDIRPWLTLRMPRFDLTARETNAIVEYFQAKSDVEVLYHFWDRTFSSQAGKQRAKKLFETLKCVRCHSYGSDETLLAGELAPDLSLTKNRLRPEWVRNWLRDPQELQPGTKMPNYFFLKEEDGAVVDLLPKPEMKIDMLVRFLFEM